MTIKNKKGENNNHLHLQFGFKRFAFYIATYTIGSFRMTKFYCPNIYPILNEKGSIK